MDTKNVCKFSSECEPGKVCADAQCLSACQASTCAPGFTCDKGVCRPGGGGVGCNSDKECNVDAPQCVSKVCTNQCVGDKACSTGKFCNDGACVIDTRPKPNCTVDSQCGGTAATPKRCLDGFCKYTCTSAQGDGYCRTIDSRIGFCAKDLVCRTAGEASAQCVVRADCSDGKNCIDNVCR